MAAPSVVYTGAVPVAVIDARNSISGIGGAMTYSVTHLSGPNLNYTEPFEGFFVFTPDTVDDAQYTLIAAEAGNGTDTDILTISALVATDGSAPVYDPGDTSATSSITETVVRQNGQWV